MYLEIEFEAENFIKFSLEILGFYGALGLFFSNLSMIFGEFSKMPRIGQSVRFGRLNPLDPTLDRFIKTAFK